MKWFKKANKQEPIHYDLYFHELQQIDNASPQRITLDRLSLSKKYNINTLKHKRIVLVIFEH